MTFNYMFYMFSTCKVCFSLVMSVVNRELFRLTEMHKLSRKRRWFTCFIVSFSMCSGVASKMNLRSIGDLGVICSHLMSLPAKLYYPRVNRSRVTCYAFDLFTQGGYPAWVINIIPFLSVIDYIRYHGSFEVWSQGQMSYFGRARSPGPGCIKQTLPRARWTD